MLPNKRNAPTTHHRAAAFTLVELLLVLLILGMLAALVSPRYAGAVARQQVDAAARRVRSDLVLAQRRARFSSASTSVVIDLTADSYSLPGMADPDHPGSLYTVALRDEPYRATIVSADFGGDTTVIFDGYGVPDSGGTIVVGVGRYTQTITLDAATPSRPLKGVLTE